MFWRYAHVTTLRSDPVNPPLLGMTKVVSEDAVRRGLKAAEVGYNPVKRGRPSYSLHTYLMANVRLVLDVEVRSGKQHASRHSQDGLWRLLGALGREHWPSLVRGDSNWGTETVMQRCEQEGLAYLLRLRQTANVKRALERRCRIRTGRQRGMVGRASRRSFGWRVGADRVGSSCCAGD